jgi:hypothetical protein
MTVATFKRLPLTKKEGEALCWGLARIGDFIDREPDGPADPLAILLAMGYTRPAITVTVEGLWETAYGDTLTTDMTELERHVLRLCVENTDWITIYRTHAPTKNSPAHIDEALAALRSLATKFEELGIEVNHLPFE